MNEQSECSRVVWVVTLLEVVLGHEVCAAGGIDKQVEVDHAGGCGGACGLVLVHSGDWAAGRLIVHKVKGGDLGVLKDSDAGHGSVVEEELVKLGAHDIPHAMDMVFEAGVKFGVQ